MSISTTAKCLIGASLALQDHSEDHRIYEMVFLAMNNVFHLHSNNVGL